MHRSDEIISFFYLKYNIPVEITNKILKIERDILFNISLHESIHQNKFNKRQCSKTFFYKFNRDNLLNDINHINGNNIKLNKHIQKYKKIKKKMKSDAKFLNSIRF